MIVNNFFSVFLVTFYPIVPTLTFLAVYWVRSNANSDDTGKNGSSHEDDIKKNSIEPKKYKFLSHWAKMAPIIEGSIEAPIQFLFQVQIFQDQTFYSDQSRVGLIAPKVSTTEDLTLR